MRSMRRLTALGSRLAASRVTVRGTARPTACSLAQPPFTPSPGRCPQAATEIAPLLQPEAVCGEWFLWLHLLHAVVRVGMRATALPACSSLSVRLLRRFAGPGLHYERVYLDRSLLRDRRRPAAATVNCQVRTAHHCLLPASEPRCKGLSC